MDERDFFRKELPKEVVILSEAVFDITLEAQYMIDQKMIEVEDSRNLFYHILDMAKEFEATREQPLGNDEDYMSDVGEYATEKLVEIFGPGGEKT